MAYVHKTKVGKYTVTDAGIPSVRKLPNGREVLSAEQLRRLEHRAAITVLESVDIEGAELRFARKALDISQSELGTILGVSSETISRWEQGKESFKRAVQLAMADLLKASLYEEYLPELKPMSQVGEELEVAIGWQ